MAAKKKSAHKPPSPKAKLPPDQVPMDYRSGLPIDQRPPVMGYEGRPYARKVPFEPKGKR